MTRARAKKYDLGRSRKSRSREKSDKLLLECGVGEYLADSTTTTKVDVEPAVMTVPAIHGQTPEAGGRLTQMSLWDQPITVRLEQDSAPSAVPQRSSSGREQPQQAAPSDPEPPTRSRPEVETTPLAAVEREHDRFTVRGFLRGCGIGLATAAGLLLIYVLVR